jgi:hypothetical protein
VNDNAMKAKIVLYFEIDLSKISPTAKKKAQIKPSRQEHPK